MKITRTANAGILLEAEGKRIIVDGVSKAIFPYLETPYEIKSELLQKGADLFLYTHAHEDHLDPDFAENFKKLGFGTPIGPKADKSLDIQNITPVKTRHIGKCDIEHISFIITAENKKLWFMGDASPLCLKDFEGECDVIVVPFAFVNTDLALKKTLATGAKDIIVLHMPGKENDEYGLWQAVLKLTADIPSVHILEMGKQIIIN